MGFTTSIFLFAFFPACMVFHVICVYIDQKLSKGNTARIEDLFLAAISLAFYGWACIWDVPRLCLYILIIYIVGKWIQATRKKKLLMLELPVEAELTKENVIVKPVSFTKVILVIGLAGLIFCLFYFKYLNFTIQVSNQIFHTKIPSKNLMAPLGISFITFSSISYLVDIYWGKASGESLVDCALYITFFPKIVSGPIVLWRDFQPQIHERRVTTEKRMSGLNRIMIGFAKKLILADTFGAAIAELQQAASTQGIDMLSAWGGVFLYMLQIYYDFAGYSDIALGLAKLFGFEFKENFNFPYRSKSIGEFWRRWHISLGTWFREYVYFPLGGSKKGYYRTLLNLAIVFALTGVWHGASWNYIIWGAVNGIFVILERVVQNRRFYQKTPDVLKWLGAMFITMMCWEMFRFNSISSFLDWFYIMIGRTTFSDITMTWQYYFDFRMVVLIVIAVLGATVLGEPKIQAVERKLASTKCGFIVQEAVCLGLFVIAILCMVNSTYSPFIYFRY